MKTQLYSRRECQICPAEYSSESKQAHLERRNKQGKPETNTGRSEEEEVEGECGDDEV